MKDRVLRELELLHRNHSPAFIYHLTLFHLFGDELADLAGTVSSSSRRRAGRVRAGRPPATKGPLFRSLWRGGRLRGRRLHHSDIPRLVKHYAQEIGLDPAEYSGHSLRAGFVTSAAVHGARLDKIMEVTRHSSAEMVLRYIWQVEAFEDHAGAAFL